MDPEVRLATQADIQQLAELQVESWNEAYRGLMPDAFLAQQDPRERALQWSRSLGNAAWFLLVAVSGARVFGFCSLVPSRDSDAEPSTGEIMALYVHPLAWRKGYGKGLVRAAFELARKQGYQRVTLWVLVANQNARAFYETQGFRADGQTKVVGSLHEVRYVAEVPAQD